MITALDARTALVLIDLQRGIVHPPVVDDINILLQNANKLIVAFRNAGLPIVIVTVDPKGGKVTRKDAQASMPTVLPAEWLDVMPEIKTEANDIFIKKHAWNAFYETCLHEELQQRNITGIVLGGVATSIGVEGTARAAAEYGYNITFALDAMTDRNAGAQQHSKEIIFPRLGETGTASDIIKIMGNI